MSDNKGWLSTLSPVLEAHERLRKLSLQRRCGLTSGCFDLLHVGHLRYLKRCRAACDHLTVLVDSDEMVAAAKGARRPIVPVAERIALLQELTCIDVVMPMASLDDIISTSSRLLSQGADEVLLFKHQGFADDVHVIGADQPKVHLVIIPDEPGLTSTTELIQRVLNRYSKGA